MKTEITNEIKAKVFVQYLGQKVKWVSEDRPFVKKGFIKEFNIEGCEAVLCLIDNYNLLLKPLSSITDEHAIECLNVRKMRNVYDKRYEVEKAKEAILGNHWPTNFDYAIETADYLRSAGYDLPNYHLNGQTLKEAGLAEYL